MKSRQNAAFLHNCRWVASLLKPQKKSALVQFFELNSQVAFAKASLDSLQQYHHAHEIILELFMGMAVTVLRDPGI